MFICNLSLFIIELQLITFRWGMMNKPRDPENFNTYGLSLQFLDSINVQPPLVKKVFVANVSIIFKNFF